MKRILLLLLAALLPLSGSAQSTVKLRLDGNDIVGAGFWTTANANTTLTGLNSATTSTLNWARLNKTGSSLADLATRSAADLSSGTLNNARLSSNVVLDTSSYSNPSWITALAGTKLTGEVSATKLQGRAVSSGAPSDGQALVWNAGGSTWQPGTASGGGGETFEFSGALTPATTGSGTYDFSTGGISEGTQWTFGYEGTSSTFEYDTDGMYTGIQVYTGGDIDSTSVANAVATAINSNFGGILSATNDGPILTVVRAQPGADYYANVNGTSYPGTNGTVEVDSAAPPSGKTYKVVSAYFYAEGGCSGTNLSLGYNGTGVFGLAGGFTGGFTTYGSGMTPPVSMFDVFINGATNAFLYVTAETFTGANIKFVVRGFIK